MLVPTLRRLDGVAETRELRDRGIRPTQLAAAVAAEDVLRVRRGWYALPETPAALLTAVRIGGRLACVSAAAHYGWATPERHAVHVCVAENASQGTDHGAAAPMFAWLGGVAGGPIGPPPDLEHLDDGDVIATCDFRSVYGDVLRWLGLDPAAVLGTVPGTAGLWAGARSR